MKYAVTILTCLALASIFPKLGATTSAVIGSSASGYALLFRWVASVPELIWLVMIGVGLIVLSWLVRRRASRSAAQRSR